VEGIARLGISIPTLIAQLLNFGLLFLLLYFFAYKRILRMLDERSRRVKESMEQTEYIKTRAEQAEEEAKKRIEAAAREGQELVARSVRTGEEVRREAQQQAKQSAEALITRARTEIERERDEAIDELRKEFADITIMAAERVIEKSLDKKAHREIIDKVLDESTTLKKG
jgi:F-type H+-transporting ATPase subunit b